MSGVYFFIKKENPIPETEMGRIRLLTATSARTILTRASTSSLTSTFFHKENSEEINDLLVYTYT